MNSFPSLSSRNSYSFPLFAALFALVLGGLLPQRATAVVNANISIWHGYDFYYPNLAGTTSTSAPVTFHWMENASGVLWKQIGDTNGVNGFWITNDLNAVIHECTNGLWKLYLNRGHVSEELYFFKMSVTGVTTNVLGDVIINSPLSGSTGVTNNPTCQWSGPSNLAEIQANAYHTVSGNSYGTTLPGNATSWTPGLLTPGVNSLFVNYFSNNFPGLTFTTPTNASGTPLAGWSAQGDLHSYMFSTFTVAGNVGNTNLFGHYTFDDEFDLKEDSSGLGNHAVTEIYSGGGSQYPQYNSAGISGGAIEFDGENAILWESDMVDVLSGSYTISLWLETTQSYGSDNDDARDGATIFAGDDSGDFPVPMALTGDKLGFHTANPDHTINSVSNINSGNFTHLVVTRDATTGVKRTYVNGVADVSGTGGTSPAIDSFEVYLGYSYYSSQGIVGLVDDLQVYTSVLSPGQIGFLYNNPGTTAPYSVGGGSSGGHTNIAHYRFDDENDLGHDDSVNDNNFSSGSSWGLLVHEYDSPGAVGSGGVRFYGVSSMFHGPPNPVFTNIATAIADSFSLSLWIRTTETVGADTSDAVDGAVVIWHYDSGTNDNIPVSITGNKVAFHTGDEFGVSQTLHSTNDVTDGNDHHIVVTRDRLTGVKKIYVDGVLEATETGTTQILNANTNYFSIGGVLGRSFDGLVDDVQIYSGVLSGAEVAALYNNPGVVIPDSTGGVITNSPVEVEMEISITRYQDVIYGNSYVCYPRLISVNVAEVTEHRVESPNADFVGSLTGSGATTYAVLDDLLNECTNGLWRLYINKNDPSEEVFTFTINVSGVDTNFLKDVVVHSPANGSSNVSTSPAFTWSGPVGFNGIFLQKYEPPFNNVVFTNLPGTATNWPSPPTLTPGTNRFYLSYHTNDTPHLTFSTPVNVLSQPLNSFTTTTHFNSDITVQFIVTGGATPVQLLVPQRAGNNFQFQFLSQSGKTNTVQSRTNLTLGTWVSRTNILGDGNTKTVVLPISGAPQEFFRVSTE